MVMREKMTSLIKRVNLDFETFSVADLKKTAAHRYAQDPSTEVLCLSYSFGDKEPKRFIGTNLELGIFGTEPPEDLFDAILSGALVYAFNTTFEYCIWRYVCIERMGWPAVPFDQWRDTQAIAASFAMPLSLEGCGDALNLDIRKDKRGKYLINKLCKPRKITKKNTNLRWSYEEAKQDYDDLFLYCDQDVRTERAVLKSFPWELKGLELDIWRNTLKKNNRGLPIDMELVNSIVEKLDEFGEGIGSQVPIITNGEIKTIGQVAKIKDWCGEHGYELPDLTAPTILEALNDKELPSIVRELLEIRKVLGKSSVKKFKKIQILICDDDRARDCLKYHKATTGREGGANLQPHNLPRASVTKELEKWFDKHKWKYEGQDLIEFTKTYEDRCTETTELAIDLFKSYDLDTLMMFYEDPMYTASALIRPSICAPDGKILRVSDYSSIENCTVTWLAGQDDILDLIREGLDLYKDMAVKLYEILYNAVDGKQRRHGKLTILGCVYGMGAKTFQVTCAKVGFYITLAEAQRTIDIFRERYYMVKKLWYGLMKAAKKAVANPGITTTYRKIKFQTKHGYLFMRLPNGKLLAYPNPRIEIVKAPWGKTESITHDGYLGSTKKWGRCALTPGRLTENASQATAREVMMEAKLRVEKAGYPVILTVHDEIISLVDEGYGSLEEFNNIMCNASDHFKGLPLKAAGFTTKRYHK